MEQKQFDKQKLIDYWTNNSDEDFDTMIVLFESRRYNWSLFVGHLLIEKLLKALYVKTKSDYPPLIHNLLRLAEKCQIDLTEAQKMFLVTVTAFNINARYDDYKKSFQQRCTSEYTTEWVEKIKINRLWIKELIMR
jgi:HEPN domain-containing protein